MLGVLMIEIFLRLYWQESIYTIDHKTQLSILKPSTKLVWKKECFKNIVKTNTLGFHAKEFSFTKAPDEFRILILGDSYVEALQVPLEKSFTTLLEEKLNKANISDKKIVVYPIGHSGNGTFLNYLYFLHYGIMLKPDLVILAFLPQNDLRDDSYTLSKIYLEQTKDRIAVMRPFPEFNERGDLVLPNPLKLRKTIALNEFAKKLRIVVFLYRKYTDFAVKLYMEKAKNVKSQYEIPIDFQVALKEYPDYYKEAWEIERSLLNIFKKKVQENGAKFLLISLTDSWRVHPETIEGNNWAKEIDVDKPEKILSEIAKELEIPYLPLVPQFREKYSKETTPETFSCDGHWNETGHRWSAEILLDYFKANKNLVE